MTEDNQSNYRETDQSVRGLKTIEQAESIRDLTQRGLDQRARGEDFCVRIDTRSDGLFDVIVLARVN